MKKNRKRLRRNNHSWDDIGYIYQQLELDLVESMKRNLVRHEKEEMKQGFKFEQWQAAKLRDMERFRACLLYTSPGPRDRTRSRMPSSA